MSDWGVALLVIFIIVVAAIAIGVLVRLFGIYNLTSCFANGEEKAVLTKNEHNGYMVATDSDFRLDSSGKFIQYDALNNDPSYVNMGERPRSPPPGDDSARNSPESITTVSVASDPSDLGHGIRRAMSCDSVASDSSVLEMQPDIPKNGQVEFALEYDRTIHRIQHLAWSDAIVQHVRMCWIHLLVPPKLWSCNDSHVRAESRTHNLCKACDCEFQYFVDCCHPTISRLTGNLHKDHANVERDPLHIRGQRPVKLFQSSTTKLQKTIYNLCSDLCDGKRTLEDTLKAIGYHKR